MLRREGLSDKGVEDALTHLASPELSPAEVAIASLARETLWYRPAPLQRHAQRVRPLFSAEEFLELVGTAALANAVCRLAAVAGES
jgi:alkylhydroperoxidase family enzyme